MLKPPEINMRAESIWATAVTCNANCDNPCPKVAGIVTPVSEWASLFGLNSRELGSAPLATQRVMIPSIDTSMRADERLSVALPELSARERIRTFVMAGIAVLALLLVWTPSIVRAQANASASSASQPGTYLVQRSTGETLREIAIRFYDDSTRWKALASANGLVASSSRFVVKSGTRLRIVGKTEAEVAALTKAAPANRAASAPTSLSAQTAGKGDADPASARLASGRTQTVAGKNTAASSSAKAGINTAAGKGSGTQASNAKRATGNTKATVAAAKVDTSAPAASKAASATAALNERPLDRSSSRIGLVTAAEMRAARGKDEPTVFMGRQSENEAGARAALVAVQKRNNTPQPRTGEYLAAPYPLAAASFTQAGRVIRRVNGTDMTPQDMPKNVRLMDEATITLPSGTGASVGQRFVAVLKGPVVSKGSFVAVPTGVFEVSRVDGGNAVLARLVSQSGIVEEGQLLVPVAGEAAPAMQHPVVAPDDNVRGTVRYILGDQLLPSLQSYLVLDATETQGVRQGDEFWLVERMGAGSDAREQRIAVVRIVRTSPLGSTGVVIDQDRAGIAVGVSARRVARVVASAR